MRPREKHEPRAAEPRAAEPPEPSQLVWQVLQLERRVARVEHELDLLALAEEPEPGGEER